jgi:ATP-dependent RNA helicase DeaD
MPPHATDEPASFTDLPLRPELLSVLAALGYEEPTPIQRETIPPLIDGVDVLGQAATGTGKTAAFALPILQRLDAGRTEPEPMALVLVPTRELAIQVSQAVHRYGRELDARGADLRRAAIGRQLRALDEGVDVVVAAGRILDHLRRGTLSLPARTVVDETDGCST